MKQKIKNLIIKHKKKIIIVLIILIIIFARVLYLGSKNVDSKESAVNIIINNIPILGNIWGNIVQKDTEYIYQNDQKMGQVMGKVNRGETIYHFYCLNNVSDEFDIKDSFEYEGKKLKMISKEEKDFRGYKNMIMTTDCRDGTFNLSNHILNMSASIQ